MWTLNSHGGIFDILQKKKIFFLLSVWNQTCYGTHDTSITEWCLPPASLPEAS